MSRAPQAWHDTEEPESGTAMRKFRFLGGHGPKPSCGHHGPKPSCAARRGVELVGPCRHSPKTFLSTPLGRFRLTVIRSLLTAGGGGPEGPGPALVRRSLGSDERRAVDEILSDSN